MNTSYRLVALKRANVELELSLVLAHHHDEAPALPYLYSLPLNLQLEPELPYHCHELDATVGEVSVSSVGDVFPGEGETEACASISVDAGDSSLGRLGRCFSRV